LPPAFAYAPASDGILPPADPRVAQGWGAAAVRRRAHAAGGGPGGRPGRLHRGRAAGRGDR